MRNSLITTPLLISFFVGQMAMAASGALFNVTASGNQTTAPINFTLCLNGKGPLSCQSYTVSQPRLAIRTTIPNHTYTIAGLKINSSLDMMSASATIVTNIEGCTPYSNGYCLFSVSDTQPANIFLDNPTATPIVFLSQTETPGDMSNNSQGLIGVAGANAICNSDAQTYGTAAVKAHSNYVALLITSSLTPCSQINSINGCAGAFATPAWPLKPGTTYFNPDGVTVFNTVTSNAIFPDTSPQGSPYPDLTYPGGSTPLASTPFWFGPQSVYFDENAFALTGWAYGNLANAPGYGTNFSLCTSNGHDIEPGYEWTGGTSNSFGAYGMTAQVMTCENFSCGPSAWLNYYDGPPGPGHDTFTTSDYRPCDDLKHILCISSP